MRVFHLHPDMFHRIASSSKGFYQNSPWNLQCLLLCSQQVGGLHHHPMLVITVRRAVWLVTLTSVPKVFALSLANFSICFRQSAFRRLAHLALVGWRTSSTPVGLCLFLRTSAIASWRSFYYIAVARHWLTIKFGTSR